MDFPKHKMDLNQLAVTQCTV